MLDIRLESISQHACAFMPKKMRFLKLVENESEKALSSTATRRSRGKLLIYVRWSFACRCPCLTCSIKITQVGISEVVYSQGYGMDNEVGIFLRTLGNHNSHQNKQTAAVFVEGGVKLRRFSPVRIDIEFHFSIC